MVTVTWFEVTALYPADIAFTILKTQFPTPKVLIVKTPLAPVASAQIDADACAMETLLAPSPEPPVVVTVNVAAGALLKGTLVREGVAVRADCAILVIVKLEVTVLEFSHAAPPKR